MSADQVEFNRSEPSSIKEFKIALGMDLQILGKFSRHINMDFQGINFDVYLGEPDSDDPEPTSLVVGIRLNGGEGDDRWHVGSIKNGDDPEAIIPIILQGDAITSRNVRPRLLPLVPVTRVFKYTLND